MRDPQSVGTHTRGESPLLQNALCCPGTRAQQNVFDAAARVAWCLLSGMLFAFLRDMDTPKVAIFLPGGKGHRHRSVWKEPAVDSCVRARWTATWGRRPAEASASLAGDRTGPL